MSLRAEQSQRLVALFVLGALLLTYPLLALFNREGSVLGLPIFYVYLFGAWAVLILMLGLSARLPPDVRRDDAPRDPLGARAAQEPREPG